MDANGLRFWMLADDTDWRRSGDPAPAYDADRKALRLASVRRLDPAGSEATEDHALPLLDAVPHTLDPRGHIARWNPGRRAITVAFEAMERDVFLVPEGQAPTDFALGADNVLYIALNGAVVLQDLKQRWPNVTVALDGFTPWRLAADPSGGVWVLDRDRPALARLEGLPLPELAVVERAPGTFRPCPEDPTPPRLHVVASAAIPRERPVAVSCSPEGRCAVLFWVDEGHARLRLFESGRLSRPRQLGGAAHPYSLAWVDDTRVAVLVFNLREAPVFSIAAEGDLVPLGALYPLPDHTGGPFLHFLEVPPHYPTPDASRPLFSLSLPSFATAGEASNATPLDSGDAATVWHRLYIEAFIPPRGGIRVWLAATDVASAPSRDSIDWHLHLFGDSFEPEPGARIPRGAWCSQPSEVPFHQGLLRCTRERDRAGLFTVLIQRAGRRVSSLRGRFLWIRVEMSGDGRSSPEIAALRAYASRFSYLDRYLPELYQETLFPPDGDQIGPATSPDFLERFLDLFESVLTPLEDRIASAYVLTDPRGVPEESLDWLAGWVGASFDTAVPAPRRRDMLAGAPELFRQRGTLGGLERALELSTGGGVSGGEIVVIENYRLRRTFATILGADLADEDDPLLGGIAASGNSFVGETLILGSEHRREFLALFSPELVDPDSAEEALVLAEFDRLANRATVIVHQEVAPQDLGLIRRIAALEAPAHVEVTVLRATHPFLVAVASLVGVDTYLTPKPGPQPVRVQRAVLGTSDLLQAPPGFDPRRGSPASSARPEARLSSALTVALGGSFVLRGGESRAAPGRRLARFLWTRLD